MNTFYMMNYDLKNYHKYLMVFFKNGFFFKQYKEYLYLNYNTVLGKPNYKQGCGVVVGKEVNDSGRHINTVKATYFI